MDRFTQTITHLRQVLQEAGWLVTDMGQDLWTWLHPLLPHLPTRATFPRSLRHFLVTVCNTLLGLSLGWELGQVGATLPQVIDAEIWPLLVGCAGMLLLTWLPLGKTPLGRTLKQILLLAGDINTTMLITLLLIAIAVANNSAQLLQQPALQVRLLIAIVQILFLLRLLVFLITPLLIAIFLPTYAARREQT